MQDGLQLRSGAQNLLEKDISVSALSTCQGLSSYRYDDSEIAAHLFDDINVKIDRDFHTPDALLDRIGAARGVIATRMHFSILALLTGTPVIAIAYEFKTLELFRSLGMGDFVIPIEDSSAEWLTERISIALEPDSPAVLSLARLEDLRDQAQGPAKDFLSSVTLDRA